MADDLFGKIGGLFEKGRQRIRDRLNLDIPDLLRAIDQNDVEMVERALNAGLNPNKRDGLQKLALPIAVDNNNAQIVALLLKAGADPNLAGRDGQTPLYKAVSWESQTIVKMLLKAGADIHSKIKSGMSPLELAQKQGLTNMIELLTNYAQGQRNEQIKEDRATHERLKKEAQERRAKKESREKRAEERATKRELAKQEREAKQLHKKYEITDENYVEALIKAIDEKDQKAIQLFAEKIQNINAISESYKRTPLIYAVEKSYEKLVIFLMDKGADPFLQIENIHHSALTKAVMAGETEMVKAMIARGGEELIELLNNKQQELSPQFLAYKEPRIMDLLLTSGGDPFFGGSIGIPPVIKAIEKGSIAMLPVLEKHGIDLNKLINGKPLLGWAIHYKRKDWVLGLVEEQADLDIPDSHGNTPLMLAVTSNQADIVRLLLEGQADTSLTNKEGETALQIAEASEDLNGIASMLKENV